VRLNALQLVVAHDPKQTYCCELLFLIIVDFCLQGGQLGQRTESVVGQNGDFVVAQITGIVEFHIKKLFLDILTEFLQSGEVFEMLESVDLHGLDIVNVQIPLKQSKITLNWLRRYFLLVRRLRSKFIGIGKVIKEVYRYIAQAHTFLRPSAPKKIKFKV